MTTRLLSWWTLTSADNTIVVQRDVGGIVTDHTIALTTGNWRWEQWPHGPTDFGNMLNLRIAAVAGGLNVEPAISGVDFTSAVYAQGRVRYSAGVFDSWQFNFLHANWTLDPLILGFPGIANPGLASVCFSDWVHRYGWYPQTCAMKDITSRVSDTMVHFASDGTRHGVVWHRAGQERQTISLAYDFIPSAFVRVDAAADAERAAGLGITVGDLCCTFERFALDLNGDPRRTWRYYPRMAAAPATHSGEFTWGANSPLWYDPLSRSIVRFASGEIWEIQMDGIQAVG